MQVMSCVRAHHVRRGTHDAARGSPTSDRVDEAAKHRQSAVGKERQIGTGLPAMDYYK